MSRRRPPFEFTKKGYRCNLDADETYLIRRLIGEVRALLTTTPTDDPKMTRLFPPAYDREIDAEANAEYHRLMHEELVASRLDSLSTIDTLLSDESPEAGSPRPITEDQLHAIATSLNSVRLVLGSLLGISDDASEDDEFSARGTSEDDPRRANMALYHYLSWLLECAVDALAHGFE